MLGLAAKARCIVSGELSVEKAIKSHSAYLVIIAKDASAGTKKKFSDSCKYYNTPIIEYSDKEELGHSIGKEFRASLAITDENFAKGISEKIAEQS